MSKTTEAIARARKMATEAKADSVVMVSEVGTSYLIGSLEKSGRMRDIPQVLGLPRTVTLALVAKLVEYNATGKVKQIASGVGSAATVIATYQFSKGQEVSGLVGGDMGASRRRIVDQAAHLRALGKGTKRGAAMDELANLEREAAE